MCVYTYIHTHTLVGDSPSTYLKGTVTSLAVSPHSSVSCRGQVTKGPNPAVLASSRELSKRD